MAGEPQGNANNDVLEITPELATKKVKLIVDGEPKFVALSEVVKEAQIGTAASKRMQDVAAEREKLKSRLSVVDLLEKGLKEEDPDTIYQGLVPLVGEEKAYKAVYGQRQEGGRQETVEWDGEENPMISKLMEEVTALRNTVGKLTKEREQETTARTMEQKRASMNREIQEAIDSDEVLGQVYKKSADDDGRGLIVETVTSAIARRLKTGEFATFGPAAIRAGLADAKKRLRAVGLPLDGQPPSPGAGSTSIPLTEGSSVHLSSDAAALIGRARDQTKKVSMSSPEFAQDVLGDIIRNTLAGE